MHGREGADDGRRAGAGFLKEAELLSGARRVAVDERDLERAAVEDRLAGVPHDVVLRNRYGARDLDLQDARSDCS